MSRELEKTYDPKKIEKKLYDKWCERKYFHAEVDRSRKPFTTVMPPPNITGKLHMGHALDNTLQDILIRYKRMEGYGILKEDMAVEGRVCGNDREPVKAARNFLRLGQRAFHHGRGMFQSCGRSIHQFI